MTIGTFVLMALETSPARPNSVVALAARFRSNRADDAVARTVADTDIPLQTEKWRNIVILDSGYAGLGDPLAYSHAVVHGAGTTLTTRRWREQVDGPPMRQGEYDYGASSIYICLEGDTGAAPPPDDQLRGLVELVRILQVQFGIDGAHVYLLSDLTGEPCPGRLFPATFRRQLLRIRG